MSHHQASNKNSKNVYHRMYISSCTSNDALYSDTPKGTSYIKTNITLNDFQNIPARTAYTLYKLYIWIAGNCGGIIC
jgi:hypothetical protein